MRLGAASTLPAREGYRLWAQRYETETAVSHLENLTVGELSVSAVGCALLDVGCGTGRRLRASNAALAVGVDATFEMLDAGRQPDSTLVAGGDLLTLPIRSDLFDVVWCRLVIGHVQDLDGAYRELARVCRRGGTIVVSDMSPESIAAGHRRTFVGDDGVVHQLEHFVHTESAHVRSATAAELAPAGLREGFVGESIKEFYKDAGRLDWYETQLGLLLVRAFHWRKADASDEAIAERGS